MNFKGAFKYIFSSIIIPCICGFMGSALYLKKNYISSQRTLNTSSNENTSVHAKQTGIIDSLSVRVLKVVGSGDVVRAKLLTEPHSAQNSAYNSEDIKFYFFSSDTNSSPLNIIVSSSGTSINMVEDSSFSKSLLKLEPSGFTFESQESHKNSQDHNFGSIELRNTASEPSLILGNKMFSHIITNEEWKVQNYKGDSLGSFGIWSDDFQKLYNASHNGNMENTKDKDFSYYGHLGLDRVMNDVSFKNGIDFGHEYFSVYYSPKMKEGNVDLENSSLNFLTKTVIIELFSVM